MNPGSLDIKDWGLVMCHTRLILLVPCPPAVPSTDCRGTGKGQAPGAGDLCLLKLPPPPPPLSLRHERSPCLSALSLSC